MTKQISNCKFVLRIGQSYFALMTQFKIFEGKRQEEGGEGKTVSQNYKHLKKNIQHKDWISVSPC